jgi:hypothetical protein
VWKIRNQQQILFIFWYFVNPLYTIAWANGKNKSFNSCFFDWRFPESDKKFPDKCISSILTQQEIAKRIWKFQDFDKNFENLCWYKEKSILWHPNWNISWRIHETNLEFKHWYKKVIYWKLQKRHCWFKGERKIVKNYICYLE